MAEFPLALTDLLGHWGSYTVFLLIGIAFGAVLEMAGFGNSRKLAAQFYFTEMTVLKVMFGAIVVAMLLVTFTSAVGLLDFNLVWVNPTYWLPGILGGLIMGVGFIVGGFCPGTSMVAAATLKLDGIFFLAGVLFGIFLFGETVGVYEDFWHSTNAGRLTIGDWFGVSTGVVVLGVVLMALAAFVMAEQSERIFGGFDLRQAPKWRYALACVVVLLAVAIVVIGQPTTEDRWNRIEAEKMAALNAREVQIHPGEMLEVMHDDRLNAMLIDVRSEAEYNLFHVIDAEHIPLDDIPDEIDTFHQAPENTVFVLMSNDEALATQAWRVMVAENVPNVYILEAGINGWLALFREDDMEITPVDRFVADDRLAYVFPTALGARYHASFPDPEHYLLSFESKVKLEAKRAAGSGGCG